MKTQRRIALHLIASVLFLSIPLFFSSGLTDPLHAFTNQYFLRNFIGYIFILGFFYINFYCLLPLYYFKRKYLRYSMFVLGCFALVLEKIPAELATAVSKEITIPTIGIGAGNGCDGQVLVMHDMLGINTEFKPRFLRQYLNIAEQSTQAVQQYVRDVKSADFPNDKEQY